MNLSVAKERLASVIKPDSVTTSQGDFLSTHVGIKKLTLLNKFEFVPSVKNYSTEEDVYKQYILNPSNKHQFIVVYGQSGTGKSHLIRWFDARFNADKPEDEVVLFIRRSDNTLKGTIRQLLQKPEVQGIANKDIIDRLANASVAVPEDKLKDMIYYHFIVEINNDDGDNEIQLNNIKRKRLSAFLNNETIHDHMMEAGGPIERIYSKVAENTFVDLDTIAQFEPEDFLVSNDLQEDMHQAGADPKAEKMASALMASDALDFAKKLSDYLNQFVSTVIQRCAGIEPGDFEQVFMDIRQELYRLGKNLTLFIEDVTSFTGVDNALLNALMEEHNDREICRISAVVGGTNAFINEKFRDNHKDRVTQYIYIPDDVLDEKGIYEFIGKYINTMSLGTDAIAEWVNSGASPDEYPIHEVTEGKDWEYTETTNGKKLYLYPFTKNSITYFYKNILPKGNQTPRYIIRDIIEPVISDLMADPNAFPSKNFSIVNINTKLNFLVHNQIKDEELANRVFKFMSIWGNNEATKYTAGETTYIAGIPTHIYSHFNMPILDLNETAAPKTEHPKADGNYQANEKSTQSQTSTGNSSDHEEKAVSANKPKIAPEKQNKLDKANAILTQWANGASISLATTGGSEGTIRAARDDMSDFLFDAINWQAEGVSLDNVKKVRQSSYKLVIFENQTKGNGLYMLPASWDSLNVVNAFIRWREFGNQSWKYSDSGFDVYLVSSWISRIKKDVVKAVQLYDGRENTKYIEAALSAEMLRLILSGEYREKSLQGLSAVHLFTDTDAKKYGDGHSQEWMKLLYVLRQNDKDNINKETVRNYFNIVQGNASGGMRVLDAISLSKAISKVKRNKLVIPEQESQINDKIKQRRDAYEYLQDITSRISKVAMAEKQRAKELLLKIYDCFDDDDIEEEDFDALMDAITGFYKEIDKTQINGIKQVSLDSIKKAKRSIVKAIRDVGAVLDEDSPLTILMTFSSDPISTLTVFSTLIDQVAIDISKAEKQIKIKSDALGNSWTDSAGENFYSEEIETIDNDLAIVGVLK